MTERWIIAAILLGAGLVLGAIGGFAVRRRLVAARGGDATSSIAGAAGLFVFWVVTLIGALASIAMVRPETLEDMPRQVLDYTPRLLAGGLILLGGYALAVGASRLVAFGLERASGRTVARVATLVRWGILAAALILALAQLGLDTTILVLVVAVVGFGFGLSAALLVGLGGQQLAREIAAGRYLARFVEPGASIESDAGSGRVVALHPATIELEAPDGARQLPFTKLLAAGFTIRDAGPPGAAGATGRPEQGEQ